MGMVPRYMPKRRTDPPARLLDEVQKSFPDQAAAITWASDSR